MLASSRRNMQYKSIQRLRTPTPTQPHPNYKKKMERKNERENNERIIKILKSESKDI